MHLTQLYTVLVTEHIFLGEACFSHIWIAPRELWRVFVLCASVQLFTMVFLSRSGRQHQIYRSRWRQVKVGMAQTTKKRCFHIQGGGGTCVSSSLRSHEAGSEGAHCREAEFGGASAGRWRHRSYLPLLPNSSITMSSILYISIIMKVVAS